MMALPEDIGYYVTVGLHVLAWGALSLGVLTDIGCIFGHLSRVRWCGVFSGVLLTPLLFSVPGALYLADPLHLKLLCTVGLVALHLCQAALPALYAHLLQRTSALHRTVATGDLAQLERLLSAGAHPLFRDWVGRSAYLWALSWEASGRLDNDILGPLRNSAVAAVDKACADSLDAGLIRRLNEDAERPWEGELPDPSGLCVVARRVWWGLRPDLNDPHGWTGLHEYAYLRAEGATQGLLRSGADVDVRTNAGWTPLHIACYCGYGNIAKLLLRGGGRLDARDNEGRTPEDIAVDRGHRRLARLMRRRWATFSPLPGWSPMDFCEDGVPGRE